LCSDWGNPRTRIFTRPTLLDAGREEIGEKKGTCWAAGVAEGSAGMGSRDERGRDERGWGREVGCGLGRASWRQSVRDGDEMNGSRG
jgi:hypothetical protein